VTNRIINNFYIFDYSQELHSFIFYQMKLFSKFSIICISAIVVSNVFCSCKKIQKDTEPLSYDTVLYRSSNDSLFRIPALAVTSDGSLIALGDHRHQHGKDVGAAMPIDIMVRRSGDYGKTWTDAKNLISCDDKVYGNDIYGFGDAAIVADRESSEVLILCVGDREGKTFGNGGRLEVHRFASTDGGKTFPEHTDVSDQFYGCSSRWKTLFVASGKIFQSRVVKTGKYYRLYCAALVGSYGEFVFYSDDFGRNWSILGNTTSPCKGGDEPKVEELPDGSVILSGRIYGGRMFNIFRYSDGSFAEGTWSTAKKATSILAQTNSTNGEILAIKQKNGDWLYLQSVPAGPGRSHVSIYFKTISAKESIADINPTSFGEGWSAYEVTDLDSAYSTMVLMPNGRVGFYYERLGADVNGYDLVFASISTDLLKPVL